MSLLRRVFSVVFSARRSLIFSFSLPILFFFAYANIADAATLTVTSSGEGIVVIGGISCPQTCTRQFNQGELAFITASPNTGYAYSWGGACSGTSVNTCMIKMDADKSATATFAAGVKLSVSISGSGGVYSSNGFTCHTFFSNSNECSQFFLPGTVHYLNIYPAYGFKISVLGGACSGTSSQCIVTMDSNKSFTVVFTAIFPRTLTVTASGPGRITSSPVGIDCQNATCTAEFPEGTSVSLSKSIITTETEGSEFTGWSGVCSGIGNCNLSMSADKFVNATFKTVPMHTVSVSIQGDGRVTSYPIGIIDCPGKCSGKFSESTTVQAALYARSGADMFVTGWSGSACAGTSSTSTTCLFLPSSDKTAQVTFGNKPPIEPSLLLHFDTNFTDSSENNTMVGIYSDALSPVLSSAQKKFGAKSYEIPGPLQPAQGNFYSKPDLFSQNYFTIDFWIYPRSFFDHQRIFLGRRTGSSAKVLAELTASGYVMFSYYNPSTSAWKSVYQGGVTLNQWNHIAIIHGKNGYYSVAVNGRFGGYVEIPEVFAQYDDFSIGGPTMSGGMFWVKQFDGYIDEFRATNGMALWTSTFTPPSKAITSGKVPSIRGLIPELPAPSAILETGPTFGETVLPVPISVKTFTRPDGTRAFEQQYGATSTLQSTVFFDHGGTTTVGAMMYNSKGGPVKDFSYGIDGATVKDINYYHDNGSIRKEILRRGNKERYNRYDTEGRLVYSHSFNLSKNDYEWSKSYIYNFAGRIQEDFLYIASDHFEKRIYTYDQDGVIALVKTFVRTPKSGTDPDYAYSETVYAGGNIQSEFKITADASMLTLAQESSKTYRKGGVALKEGTYNYNTKNYELVSFWNGMRGKVFVSDEVGALLSTASSTYAFSDSRVWRLNLTETYLKNSSSNIKDFERLEYFSKGAVKKRTVYSYYDTPMPGTNVHTSKSAEVFSYNNDGTLLTRTIFEYANEVTPRITAYRRYLLSGELESDGDYSGMNPSASRYYDSAGNKWYEQRYVYASDGTYTFSQYYSFNNELFLRKSERYRQIGSLVNVSSDTSLGVTTENKLSKKDVGNAILASMGIMRDSITATSELPTIATVVKKFVTDYKNRLASLGSSATDVARERVYNDIVSRLEQAVRAVEYKLWASTKGWTTDQKLEDSATAWVGVDARGTFKGFYVMPKGVPMGSANSAFIDMTDMQAMDRVLQTANYQGLLAFEKRKEKWDSFYDGRESLIDTATNKLFYYNALVNNGAGAYLTLFDYAVPDPSINLLLEQFERDMKAQSIDLTSLSEVDVARAFYKYFFATNVIKYLHDPYWRDSVQYPSQTLARGGGDCDDNAMLTFSLLRNLFLRLDNRAAADRVGVGFGSVDTSGTISSSNPGSGHATVIFKDASGAYWHLESAVLYMGDERSISDADLISRFSVSGGLVDYSIPAKWHGYFQNYMTVDGTQTFTSSVPGGGTYIRNESVSTEMATYGIALPNTNPYNRMIALPFYIAPFGSNVDAVANRMFEFMPHFTERSANDVVEFVHDALTPYMAYQAESTDQWTDPETTLQNADVRDGVIHGAIAGDSEDLAFVEASILENALIKFYVSKGIFIDEAITRASESIILLAKQFSGLNTNASLVVGFLITAPDKTTIVRIIDPLNKDITEDLSLDDLKKSGYILSANTKEVKAVSFAEWGEMLFGGGSTISLRSYRSLLSVERPYQSLQSAFAPAVIDSGVSLAIQSSENIAEKQEKLVVLGAGGGSTTVAPAGSEETNFTLTTTISLPQIDLSAPIKLDDTLDFFGSGERSYFLQNAFDQSPPQDDSVQEMIPPKVLDLMKNVAQIAIYPLGTRNEKREAANNLDNLLLLYTGTLTDVQVIELKTFLTGFAQNSVPPERFGIPTEDIPSFEEIIKGAVFEKNAANTSVENAKSALEDGLNKFVLYSAGKDLLSANEADISKGDLTPDLLQDAKTRSDQLISQLLSTRADLISNNPELQQLSQNVKNAKVNLSNATDNLSSNLEVYGILLGSPPVLFPELSSSPNFPKLNPTEFGPNFLETDFNTKEGWDQFNDKTTDILRIKNLKVKTLEFQVENGITDISDLLRPRKDFDPGNLENMTFTIVDTSLLKEQHKRAVQDLTGAKLVFSFVAADAVKNARIPKGYISLTTSLPPAVKNFVNSTTRFVPNLLEQFAGWLGNLFGSPDLAKKLEQSSLHEDIIATINRNAPSGVTMSGQQETFRSSFGAILYGLGQAASLAGGIIPGGEILALNPFTIGGAVISFVVDGSTNQVGVLTAVVNNSNPVPIDLKYNTLSDATISFPSFATPSFNVIRNVITPLQCINLCTAFSGLRVTSKPNNSSFVGPISCSSSQVGSCNDSVFYQGWLCNNGFIRSSDRQSCIPIPTEIPSPTVTLSAASTTINQGESAILTWTSQNATQCLASGGWTGTKSANGIFTETIANLQETTTYILTCSNQSDVAANATVSVIASNYLLRSEGVFETSRSGTVTSVVPQGVRAWGIAQGAFDTPISLSAELVPAVEGVTVTLDKTTLSPTEYAIGTVPVLHFTGNAVLDPATAYVVRVTGIAEGITRAVDIPLTVKVLSGPPKFREISH